MIVTPASDLRYGAVPGNFENSIFNSDSDMSQIEYGQEVFTSNEPNYEATSIQAGIEQAQAYANDAANHAANTVTASRIEAQFAALPTERDQSRENQYHVEYAHELSWRIRHMRDTKGSTE